MTAEAPGLQFENCGDGKFRITSQPEEPDTVASGCGCLIMVVMAVIGIGFGGVTVSVLMTAHEVPTKEMPVFIVFILFLGAMSACPLFLAVNYLWRATYGIYPRVFEIDVQQRILTLKRAGKKDRGFPFSDVNSVQLLIDESSIQQHCLSFSVRGVYGNVEIHWAARSANEQSTALLSDAGNAIAAAIDIPFKARKAGVRVWRLVSGI